jgi:hypothetical protein
MASYRPLSIWAFLPLHPYDGPQTKRLFRSFGKGRRHDVEAARAGLYVRNHLVRQETQSTQHIWSLIASSRWSSACRHCFVTQRRSTGGPEER